jgi:hypothetical protein
LSSERAPLTELVLLASGELAADPTYGATKLNKALFLADMLHYRRYGEPVTGATYERLPRAPAPRGILAARQALLEAGDATLEVHSYLGHQVERLIGTRPADRSRFADTALELAGQVCDSLRGHSHVNVLGWQLAAEHEVIPYPAIFLSAAAPDQGDLERGRALAADRGLAGSPRRSGGPGAAGGEGLPGDRVPRQVTYECPTEELRAGYPRVDDVLDGVEWGCARWRDGFHRIPGTRLAVLRTAWPIPVLRVYFSLPDEARCTVWAIDQVPAYAPGEDGSS